MDADCNSNLGQVNYRRLSFTGVTEFTVDLSGSRKPLC